MSNSIFKFVQINMKHLLYSSKKAGLSQPRSLVATLFCYQFEKLEKPTRSICASDHDLDLVATVLVRSSSMIWIMTSHCKSPTTAWNWGVNLGGTGGGKAWISLFSFLRFTWASSDWKQE